MELKIGRGGRVAAATVLATLLLSLAFVSAFKLAPQAQPAYAPCSRSCAACASASPGAASGAASVEWLNGSEKASAVEKALSLEEFMPLDCISVLPPLQLVLLRLLPVPLPRVG
jgi:hypothetical protein